MGAEFLELEFEEDGTGDGGYAKVMSKEFNEFLEEEHRAGHFGRQEHRARGLLVKLVAFACGVPAVVAPAERLGLLAGFVANGVAARERHAPPRRDPPPAGRGCGSLRLPPPASCTAGSLGPR